MKEITEKIHKQALDTFLPIAEQLASEGATEDDIVAAFQRHVKVKTAHFHKIQSDFTSFPHIMRDILVSKPDSHTEFIFYNLLKSRKLAFEFQYKIGPYTADYLFGGSLVVEIDGPQHTKQHDDIRDSYMRRMGYRIIRVPTWVLSMDPDAVVDEIVEQIDQLKPRTKANIRR